jgi:DASH complex subunit ASK1
MSQYADILSRPPFYAIAGVDSRAPIPQQMEQIDQLNTLLLQQIDANFARLHSTVTTRILPEIKRFALANQPTREAAAFWTNFYAQAFGERPGEGSTVDETRYEETTSELGGSFFDPAATSTPMKRRDDDSLSLDDSLGSPFDRVDRQLSRLSLTNTDEPTPSLPSGYDFGRSPSPDTTAEFDSTLRFEPPASSTPRPRVLDPDSPTAHKSPMTRLIDLTSTPLGKDFRPLAPSAGRSLFSHPAARPNATASSSNPAPRNIFDEDDDDVKLGMSPPKTMKYHLPPRAQSIVTAGTTPIKAPPDLMDMSYEPSPRIPTPRELRRYSSVNDLAADLESIDDADDSLDDTEGYAAQAAEGFEFVDNSYDSDMSGYPRGADSSYAQGGETSLFGKPAPGGGGGSQFALHQQDEMVTYHGGRLEDADAPDSPTQRRR